MTTINVLDNYLQSDNISLCCVATTKCCLNREYNKFPPVKCRRRRQQREKIRKGCDRRQRNMVNNVTQIRIILSLVCLFSGLGLSYNDDKPVYKWSPLYFRNLKKDFMKFSCAAGNTECGFTRLPYGMIMRLPCCDGLVCKRLGKQHVCLKPWSWDKTNEVY
ncbi:uncharacterized protein LOC143237676 [Tachypleus tridentatus]|uniref:uncharacterized protein LOC143237676 n=1 Tax=Tachypleus tridentatus TaxID=6853 RepID=UPI003FD5F196